MTDSETRPAPVPAPPETAKSPGPKQASPARGSLPVLGGRLLVGIALLFGIAAVAPQGLNAWLDRKLHPNKIKPAVAWQVDTEADVEITLITADARRLQCAHDDVFDGAHCGYGANKRPWPRVPGALIDDNDENVIQPYRTADTNALILVAGLWAQPELALRLHREPPSHYDSDKLLRFVAYCRVRFLGEMKKAALRWDTGAKWNDDQSAMVARPVRCTLDGPSG